MAVVAVQEGRVSEEMFRPRIGAYPGHVGSTEVLAGAVLLVSVGNFGWTAVECAQAEKVLIGVLITVLTVGFRCLDGDVENTPVTATLERYHVLVGRVWIAVPITLLVAPLLFRWYLSPNDSETARVVSRQRHASRLCEYNIRRQRSRCYHSLAAIVFIKSTCRGNGADES